MNTKSLMMAALLSGVAGTGQGAGLPYKGLSLTPVTLQPAYVYTAKFVCGTQALPNVGIGQTVSYPSATPGDYATSLDILSLNQATPDIRVKVVMLDPALSAVLAPIAMPSELTLEQITCDDILQELKLSPALTVYEGRLIIERYQADLDVKAVYSYAAREKFAEWLGVDVNGTVVSNPEFGIYSIGGAGGFGVGASVDVENVLPINRRSVTVQ